LSGGNADDLLLVSIQDLNMTRSNSNEMHSIKHFLVVSSAPAYSAIEASL